MTSWLTQTAAEIQDMRHFVFGVVLVELGWIVPET